MPDAGAPLPNTGVVHQSLKHDSADKHVAGSATYIDDIPEASNLLHVFLGMSERAHARIVELDLTAVRAAPGVVDVVCAADIPGKNDVSPVVGDDPLFADGVVQYLGQSLFAVAAESLEQARAAAALAKVVYEDLPPILTLEEARAAGSVIETAQVMRLGDVDAAIAAAPHRLEGRLAIGGQDHFYLEGQIALATPGEDGDVHVWSSTQHPTEIQHNVAKVLGVRDHAVRVEVRRMGGGFGGKESQPALFAAAAALIAVRNRRPAKLRLDRDDDMVMTGKRHDFETAWSVGYDGAGRLAGAAFEMASRCGYSADLSMAINDRAMFHSDNAYALQATEILSHRCRTNTVSNTAFRGFGGPQGMMGIERAIDAIALELGLDPLDVRKANLYGVSGVQTPYGQTVDDSPALALIERLEASSDYRARRKAIDAWNAKNRWLKRGIALTPVKFGISFTATHLNQAGALVHVYTDGSVMLNHGGTEMGQGLYQKVAQVVADALGVDLDRVRITATATDKVPNTSATAASSGSDLNGMAALDAASQIKARLTAFAAAEFEVAPETLVFAGNEVRTGAQVLTTFTELARRAWFNRVSLSAAGFYKTPKIHYDRATHQGRPFFYYAWGAAVSEVIIDTLTGENRCLRADILHDCGASLNPAIDLGQIEGGFVQGMGWLTTEELVWDAKGALKTHAPSTYKIPACSDRPPVLNIAFWDQPNPEHTIHRSKAVGEPPLMLAISVFSALTQAVAAVGEHSVMPSLDAPATPERILMAVDDVRRRAGLS